MSTKRGRPLHWLLRAIAVCLGIVFILFGGVFVAACVAMLAQGENAPAAAKVGTTVQVVTTVIFALVALTGVFLVWVGLRRATSSTCSRVPEAQSAPLAASAATPPAHRSTAQASESDQRYVVRAEPQATGTARPIPPALGDRGPSDTEFGQFIARCGPEKSGEMYNYVSAGVYLLLALLCIIAPGRWIELKIDPALAAKIALIPAGIGVAAAILHLWTPLFGAPQTIELYERGIVERLGRSVRRVELAMIGALRLQEWYEHRFAARTINVKAQVLGQRQLAFNTSLRGDGDQIVEYLAANVPNSEYVEFNATL